MLIDSWKDIGNLERLKKSFAFRYPGLRKEKMILFEEMKSALMLESKIKIEYCSTGGEVTTRVIKPLSLTRTSVRAHCELRNKVRSFLLHRIRKTQSLSDKS